MPNKLPGIGDPYWYEWSVGLEYIIKMLNPDNKIKSVALQSTKIQGLDDVVVSYSNGKRKYIQVKHARGEKYLTFNELVTSTGEAKPSLLKHLSMGWKKAIDSGDQCEVILYTNRVAGKKKSKWPALAKFYSHFKEQLDDVEDFEKISFPKEWESAWKEWCNQFSELNNEEKLRFLNDFKLEDAQPNLDKLGIQILNKIANSFSISKNKALSVFQALDHALREWTTSRRRKETIDIEMVYEKLSKSTEDMIGDHALPPPEPFFPSRKDIILKLEQNILKGNHPIIFLTGPPGIGKTSIVSELTNRLNPVVHLRFYAFRPITPDNTLVPADSGKTATPEALWGDLLSQLRSLFKGKLSKYKVPIRNEFLSVEQLRKNVLRLAQIYASEINLKTVIAIDGIDHAARADLNRKSFIATLIPPDEVPEDVCFLIAGQPAKYYDKYPGWLRSNNDNILVIEVKGIEEKDIYELLSAQSTPIPKDQLDSAARLISDIADGNTLSAIFAAHEAKRCNCVEELKEIIERRSLRSGIQTYYESIWKSAIEGLEIKFPYIGYKIAGCFSLSSMRLTPGIFSEIFQHDGINVSIWRNILRDLAPLIIEETGGFRILHNDVRVHLTQILKAEPEKFREIAGMMADCYMKNTGYILQKHIDLVTLLQKSDRETDIAQIITPEFVLEAYGIERPLSEIQDQIKIALKAALNLKDWDVLHILSCSLMTLKQLQDSLSLIEQEITPYVKIPPVLLSEGKVIPMAHWNCNVINSAINDVMKLISSGKIDRARGIMKRWFCGIEFSKLLKTLPDSEIYERRGEEKILSEQIIEILESIGKITQHIGWVFQKDQKDFKEGEPLSHSDAYITRGYLKEAMKIGGKKRWVYSIKNNKGCFIGDMELYIYNLAKKRRWFEVAYTLRRPSKPIDHYPVSFQIKAASYSLLCNKESLIQKWVIPLIEKNFYCIEDYESQPNDDSPYLFTMVCFILGWTDPARESSSIKDQQLSKYFKKRRDENGRTTLAVLFNSAALIGRWYGSYIRRGTETAIAYLTTQKLESILSTFFKIDSFRDRHFFNASRITGSLLEIIIECSSKLGGTYDKVVSEMLYKHVSNFKIDYHLETIWKYLADRGYHEFLKKWYLKWVGPDGDAWKEDIPSRNDIAQRFIKLAKNFDWPDDIDKTRNFLRWGILGYRGHKEYSLYTPLAWYEILSERNPECWKNEGIKLFEISKEVSKAGDNRASFSIIESIVGDAISCGLMDLWKLSNMENEISSYRNYLFDGLIKVFNKIELSENELEAIWAFAIGSLHWQQRADQEMFVKIKDLILHLSEQKQFKALPSKLKEIGPTEFNLKPPRHDSVSEYAEEKKQMEKELSKVSILEAISRVHDLFHESQIGDKSFNWRTVRICAEKIEQEKPANFYKLVRQLFNLLKKRKYKYSWHYDGIGNAFEKIVPLLTEDDKLSVAADIIENVKHEKDPALWIDSISTDLDSLCLYRARSYGANSAQKGFFRLINMHKIWITSAGKLPNTVDSLSLPEIENNIVPGTWSQFVLLYLLRRLDSKSAIKTEAALRGIWALLQVDSTILKAINKLWNRLSDDAKEYLLLLAEKIAVEMPDNFNTIKDAVFECYNGYSLRLKIQSWIVLKSYERSTGGACPTLTFKKPGNYKVMESLNSMSRNVVLKKIPDCEEGMLNFPQSFSIVNDRLKFLRIATHDNLVDLESKLSHYLIEHPQREEEIEPEISIISGDIRIKEDYYSDKLMEIIYYELHNKRWNDVPFIRIAQALSHGEDPFVFCKTSEPASDIDDWPNEDEIKLLLKKGKKDLENRLLKHALAGIDSNTVVLGAEMHVFSYSKDITFIYNLIMNYDKLDIIKSIRESGTFFARSCAFYDKNRFDPVETENNSPSSFRMNIRAGGFFRFLNSHIWCFPSIIWQRRLGWEPSPKNPFIWHVNGREAIKFERIAGPVRDSFAHDIYYRHPLMQRWVCKEDVFRNAEKLLKNTFRPEIKVEIKSKN